jgi:hypothetical protein
MGKSSNIYETLRAVAKVNCATRRGNGYKSGIAEEQTAYTDGKKETSDIVVKSAEELSYSVKV